MIKHITIFVCVTFLAACGSPYLITVPSLAAQQPKVISILPKDKAITKANAAVSVVLSRDIDKETVGKYSFLVVENYTEQPPDIIKDELKDAKIAGIEGTYHVNADSTCITFIPQDGLKPSTTYGVILTPELKTKENFPLTKIFVSQFTVSGDSGAEVGPDSETGVSEPEVQSAESEALCEDANLNISEDQGDASETTSDTSGDVSGDTAEDTPGQQEGETPPAVVLNEVYYDATDSDTDGNLFIELKGTPDGNIAGYKLVMVNGDDGKATATVTIPVGATISAEGFYVIADAKTNDPKATNVSKYDYIANFDPQNGPDSVQLVDGKGGLVDAVCYGATSATVAENKLAMCEGGAGPDASAGSSISRQPGAEDTNDNAADFVINVAPSPGDDSVTKE